MYHDQGHIPSKLLDFEGGVNIALGLPIIRTSVDHGTAFEIAWKGMATNTSLLKAIEFAERLARVSQRGLHEFRRTPMGPVRALHVQIRFRIGDDRFRSRIKP